MIYFVQAEGGGLIKIGTSVCLTERLRQLELIHGDGLSVLAVMPGSFDVERTLHDRFAHLWEGGEWFRDNGELTEFISRNASPWDGTNDRAPYGTVKLDREVLSKAKFVADTLGITVAEYLSETMRPLVIAEFLREAEKAMQT